MSRFSLLLLSSTALCLAGCWTSASEGKALRQDVDQVKKTLDQDVVESQRERKKLRGLMEQATALLTRNSADIGAQVERMQDQVTRLTGDVEELQKKHNELSQALNEFRAKVDVKLESLASGTSATPGPAVPEDKNELFKLGADKLKAGEHQEARRVLRHFLDRFSDDKRVDQVQLMLGDSYFAEQKFAPAIVEYKKIIEQHQKSAARPEALYKIGMSFYQLKFCSDAQLFLRQLVRQFPRHDKTSKAKKILTLIKRYGRNPKFCR